MLILALETSGSTASAAVMRGERLLAEYSLHDTRTHSKALLPLVDALLSRLHIEQKELQAIAVDCGPGSFTGVRIGVNTANAMGLALGIPVIGVCSLQALYENIALAGRTVCAMIDARNETVYVAAYKDGACMLEPQALAIRQALMALPAESIFVGDGAKAYEATIRETHSGAIFAPEHYHFLRAGSLATIASRMLAGGAAAPQYEAAPLYLRPSQAERLQRAKLEGE